MMVAVPKGVVTEMDPEAPAPTTALMSWDETILKLLAGTPPKLTAVAPERLVPCIAMVEPFPPEAGEKEVIVGIGI